MNRGWVLQDDGTDIASTFRETPTRTAQFTLSYHTIQQVYSRNWVSSAYYTPFGY